MIGGEVDEAGERTATPDIYSCDETIEQWQPEPLLKQGRASLGVAILDDKLYAIGGRDGGESKF